MSEDTRPEVDLHLPPSTAMVVDSVEAIEAAMKLAARQTVQIDKRASRRLKKINPEGNVTGEVESAAVLKALVDRAGLQADYHKATQTAEVKAARRAIRERRAAGLPDLCHRCGEELGMSKAQCFRRLKRAECLCQSCSATRRYEDKAAYRLAESTACECGRALSMTPAAVWQRTKSGALTCCWCSRSRNMGIQKVGAPSVCTSCKDPLSLNPGAVIARRNKALSGQTNFLCRPCVSRRLALMGQEIQRDRRGKKASEPAGQCSCCGAPLSNQYAAVLWRKRRATRGQSTFKCSRCKRKTAS